MIPFPLKNVFKSNGEIIIGGTFPTSTTDTTIKNSLLQSTDSNTGRIYKMNSEGTEILSETTIGDRIKEIKLDTNENIIVATDKGLTKISENLSSVIWHKDFDEIPNEGSKNYHVGLEVKTGRIIYLNDNTIYVFDDQGELLDQKTLEDTDFTTDIAYDSDKNVIYAGGYNNR